MKNYLPKKASLLIAALLLIAGMVKSQNIFTMMPQTQCYSAGNNTAMAYATTIPPGTTTFSWNVTASGSPTACVTSITSFTSMNAGVFLNFPCCGLYTVVCTAYNASNTPIGSSSQVATVTCPQTISVTGSSQGSVCAGDTITLNAFGASTYTWNTGSTGFMIVVSPSASACYSVIGTMPSGCQGMGSFCVNVMSPPSITVSGADTICKGSSTNLMAGGNAVSYTWMPGATSGSSVNVMPTVSSNYTVYGLGANGCWGWTTHFVNVDSTCSDVWPGDANSDGIVNTSDVFEIGLAFSNTGPARIPGGNTYISQYADNWTGTVSTGKNKCHADCNGDGTVNNADTVAIYNNFSLTHPFRPAASSAAADISLDFGSSFVQEGVWNKADIILGSSSSPVSQVYGVAFDVNFNQSLIETNSAYIVYTSSFLNASNQNVQFRKTNFANGKIHAASVRVNGAHVNGNGKIGEFWFKVKTGLPNNTAFSASISNSGKIDNSGNDATLNGGGDTAIVLKGVGIKELTSKSNFSFFPNPAGDKLTLLSDAGTSVTYHMYDLTGREIMRGEFTHSHKLDVSALEKGAYIVKFENEDGVSVKKLVIDRN